MAEQEGVEMPPVNRPSRWPLIVMALMVLGTWSVAGFDYYDRHRHISPKPIILSWGVNQPNTCGAQIDGGALVGRGKDYRVALICGISDPAIDRFDDTRITVTRFFTISDGQTFITSNFSKEMTDGIDNMVAQTTKGQPTPASGMQLAVQWGEWVCAVVVPATVELTDIHRLSDISRLGGTIVDGHQFAATSLAPRR
jgi:hypothetical protein